MESQESAYERGHLAGEVASRLAGHDRHFMAINGHLGDISTELHDLKLSVQRLADQAVARDATVVTTAAALKDAEEARRGKSEQNWSPIQKVIAVIGGLGVLAGMFFGIYRLTA